MEGAQLVQSLVERHLEAARSSEAVLYSLMIVWVSDVADQNHRYAALQFDSLNAVALAADRLRDVVVMSTAGV